MDTQQFISRATEVHSGFYDYSEVEFRGLTFKVRIRCPVHGEFLQVAGTHLKGSGCKKCANQKKNESRRLTLSDFKARMLALHGDRYDLSRVSFSSTKDKVEVVCRLHGPFHSQVGNLLQGKSNCPRCKYEKQSAAQRLAVDEYLTRFRALHGTRYTYGDFTYDATGASVLITCPEHGGFKQRVQDHLRGYGCSRCWRPVVDTPTFVDAARQRHGDRYDYSRVQYVSATEKVVIGCPEHGEFHQRPSDHVNTGHGCPICGGTGPSRGQLELRDFLAAYTAVQLERPLKAGGRLDLYLPEFNLGIEYHGLIWHSTRFHTDPYNLRTKTQRAEQEGIEVLHIFQDEWELRQSAVTNLLKCRVSAADRVYARDCRVAEVSELDAVLFVEHHHIQGAAVSCRYLGLYYQCELVAVMAFSGTTSNRKVSRSTSEWELRRYCSRGVVVGGASKLFRHFIRLLNPSRVVSYSDSRIFKGQVYSTLGFVREATVRPTYYYVTPGLTRRFNKSRFQLAKQAKLFGASFDPSLTELENCRNNGWYQLYDCGKVRWVWTP